RKDGNSGYLQGPRFTANIPEIESFVRIQSSREDIRTGTEVVSQDVLYVDSNFFSVFSFPLVAGSATACLNDPLSVVLSEEAARRQFGTTDAVGKAVLVKKDGAFVPHKVTAVARQVPQNSSIKFSMLLPLRVTAEELSSSESWFNFFLNTFVVLSPHADPKAVEAKMKKFYEADSREAIKALTERYGSMDFKNSYFLQPFTAMHLDKDVPPQNGLSDASNPVYSYILSGIALFILLIASINFVNLTVARSVKRAKEIGIRKVVGGARRQLITQFLGESMILCLIAFLLAVALVQLVLPVFNTLANKALSFSYLMDTRLVAGYALLFLVTSLLAGFYPALVLSRYNPVDTLYSRFQLGGKNYLQKTLVVVQFSLASFFIIATLAIYAQFHYLTNEDLGYDDSHLVLVNKQMLTRSEAALLRTELLKNPAIREVAFKNGGSWGTIAKVNGDSSVQFAYETVDANYMPLLKLQLKQGRFFSKDLPSDSTKAILVNEAFVRQAGWKAPLGQIVDFWYNPGEKYTVVGVIKDYHFAPLHEKIQPQLFTMKPDNQFGLSLIKVQPKMETAGLKHIERTFKQLFPMHPFSYQFKEEENLRSYEAESKWKQIMLYSALLTIFISCIGLFGLSVLSAEKRIKEIGIRKVLGASVSNVVLLLSRDFVKLVVLALLIAIPAAWMAADEWLQNYPYRITLGWPMFVLAGVLVVVIALSTVSFQAVKAAIANPTRSLRSE
ncbi:MAG TPA: ABC transporter permease, partial [Chitinophagaceae bacterium]|nr:ABC transporter permease [Chitinophagaceae bacterium]